jgi:predicted acetyltransferase
VKPDLVLATENDCLLIQNMARFYVYDVSRTCGFISHEWAIPSDGLYECFGLEKYFNDPDRHAYLIKVNGETAGFALIKQGLVIVDQVVHAPDSSWHLGEFFILAKFQGKGIGRKIVHQIWNLFSGVWEVSVIPENKPAYSFWKKTIGEFTNAYYKEELCDVTFDEHQPKRIVFTFETCSSKGNMNNTAKEV